MRTVTNAAATVARQLEDLQTEIERTKIEIAQTEAAPVPVEEAVARLRALLDEMAGPETMVAQRLAYHLVPALPPPPATRVHLLLADHGDGEVKALLTTLLRKPLEDWATRVLRERHPGGGLTEAERAAQLTRLRTELHRLETEEELTILRAERAGLELDRRLDCDLDVILETHLPEEGETAV